MANVLLYHKFYIEFSPQNNEDILVREFYRCFDKCYMDYKKKSCQRKIFLKTSQKYCFYRFSFLFSIFLKN